MVECHHMRYHEVSSSSALLWLFIDCAVTEEHDYVASAAVGTKRGLVFPETS